MAGVQFQIWTSYHPPVGLEERGHNEFYWLSTCGRWHARPGNGGTMILRDRTRGVVYVVPGKMPAAEAKVRELLLGESDGS